MSAMEMVIVMETVMVSATITMAMPKPATAHQH
jgi:hypothetical protein